MKVEKRLMEPRLIPRIKEYLNGCESAFVDLDEMASALRKQHREYGRKKKGAFLIAVTNAYELVQKKGTLQNQITPERHLRSCPKKGKERRTSIGSEIVHGSADFEASHSEDNENYVTYEDTNSINNAITALYRQPKKEILEDGELKFIIDKNPSLENGMEEDRCSKLDGIPLDINPSTIIQSSKKRKLAYPVQSTVSKKSSVSIIPKDVLVLEHSSTKFSDIGGCENHLIEICKLVMHLKHPELYQRLGVKPPRGFLLHGPPGCGKTTLAYAIAGELELPFIKIAATELVSGVSGDSEQKIRDLFSQAMAFAPCILFLDEIDAIAPRRDTAQREMERRIVSQLLSCLDDLERSDKQVMIIGATNRPDSIDPALRRAGRFDKEIGLGMPDENSRTKIIEVVCRNMLLEPELSFRYLARLTPGYVGADLSSLAREACVVAINRLFRQFYGQNTDTPLPRYIQNPGDSVNDLNEALRWLKEKPPINFDRIDDLYVKTADFKEALKNVTPSAKREGFATVPDVKWDDVGALASVRENLKWSILYPIKHPEAFESYGLSTRPQGILLCGPPGCGKTLVAKAVANESGMNFISVKGPELLSMYVGESERAVRQVFQRASNSAPCVIFFDELDALCPRRSDHESGGAARVVNQMLTEMDGIESRKLVFIVGATNRPDIIDPAIMRPGRLDKILYVGFPSVDDKIDILRAITKNRVKPPISDECQFATIAKDERSQFFSGADLAHLVHEAAVVALKERLENVAVDYPPSGYSAPIEKFPICQRHFDLAFAKVKPSVSGKERETFEKLRLKYEGN